MTLLQKSMISFLIKMIKTDLYFWTTVNSLNH